MERDCPLSSAQAFGVPKLVGSYGLGAISRHLGATILRPHHLQPPALCVQRVALYLPGPCMSGQTPLLGFISPRSSLNYRIWQST